MRRWVWIALLVSASGCKRSEPPATREVLHPGAPISNTGNILKKVPPVYPPVARAARVQGTVLLHAIIGRDGHVENLDVVSGPPLLQGAAIDAVSQWVYKPYLVNGEPVRVETTVQVNFTLTGK